MDFDIFPNGSLQQDWKEIDPQYQQIVIDALDRKMDLDIQNSDMSHAIFLIYILIKKAKKKIRIFTGKLWDGFYNDSRISKVFEEAVNKGVNIEIIIESGKIKDIPKCISNKVKLFHMNKKNPLKNHIIISDDESFRIEQPHKDSDLKSRSIKAIVNFNSPDIAKKMGEFFDNHLRGEEIIT
ncbi:MAG: hypothetical protein AABX35_02385 [Nanoarchaeota archaeon]